MEIRYSDHARERMGERRVSERDVELALRHSIGDPAPGQPGTLWVEGHAVGGRILRVCVAASDRTFVITLAWR